MKHIMRYAAIAIAAAISFNGFANDGQFSAGQVKDIQKIVHDYLISNPEVLVTASQALQAKMQLQQEQDAMAAIKQNKKDLFSDSSSPVAGNPKGDVTLVEFFDYQCGHCKEMNPIVQSIVKKNSDLRVIFKELPIFGGNSQFAAKAALAAAELFPDKYYAFHDALLSADNPLSDIAVFKAARSVGFSEDQIKQIKAKMNDASIQNQLKANFQLAQALKLAGTPAFIMANKAESTFRFIPGSTTEKDMQDQLNGLK